MIKSLVDVVVNQIDKNNNIIVMAADLGYAVLDPIQQKFPNNFINCGVSEQNMISMASGLASCNKQVLVYSNCNFTGLRVLEQIRNCLCYCNSNVKIIAVGAGMEYNYLGFSHHGMEDVGALFSLPNMRIYSPSTKLECVDCIKQMLSLDAPCYIRLNKKSAVDSLLNEKNPDANKWLLSLDNKKTDSDKPVKQEIQIFNGVYQWVKKSSSKVCICTTGNILSEVIKAVMSINIDIDLFSIANIKPMDAKFVNYLKDSYNRIFVVEEHNKYFGLGSILATHLKTSNIVIDIIGMNDTFCTAVDTYENLLKIYGLDYISIKNSIENSLKTN